MNTIRREIEKSVKLINIIPKTVKTIENEFLNPAFNWPPKAF
ncbi:hypothetical protein JCM14469_24010 [Desulfatiferula olefinivorans]